MMSTMSCNGSVFIFLMSVVFCMAWRWGYIMGLYEPRI